MVPVVASSLVILIMPIAPEGQMCAQHYQTQKHGKLLQQDWERTRSLCCNY
jgi:hypothetical protein